MDHHTWRRAAEAPPHAPPVLVIVRRATDGAPAANAGRVPARDRPTASNTRRRRAHATATPPFVVAPIERGSAAAAAAPRARDKEAAQSPVLSPVAEAEADARAAGEVAVHVPVPPATAEAVPVSIAAPLPARRQAPRVHISRHGSVCIGGESAAERPPTLPSPSPALAFAPLHRDEASAASPPSAGGQGGAGAGESARRALIVENAMLRHQMGALLHLNLVLRAKVEVFMQHSAHGVELAPAAVPLPLVPRSPIERDTGKLVRTQTTVITFCANPSHNLTRVLPRT